MRDACNLEISEVNAIAGEAIILEVKENTIRLAAQVFQ